MRCRACGNVENFVRHYDARVHESTYIDDIGWVYTEVSVEYPLSTGKDTLNCEHCGSDDIDTEYKDAEVS